MLASNLVRDGVDLAFQTNLLYLDVINSRVGIKTAAPGAGLALDVNGAARIQSDLEVTGDLTVSGNTTLINTTNLEVEDNMLLLNSTGSVGNDAGIMINRGAAGNNAVFYWDEDEDTFKLVVTTSDGSTVTEITDSAFANFKVNDLTANSFVTDGITIADNSISTTRTNDDLVLNPAGTGGVDVSSSRIKNVSAPSAGSDAANKDYVDSVVSSIPDIGEFSFSGNKITQTASNADFELDAAGTGNFVFIGTSGVVIPSGTTAQRPSAQTGIIRYNTDTAKYEVSQDGSTWTALRTEQTSREVIKDVFTGDGSTQTFSSPNVSTAPENILVYIDGVMQEPETNYTTDGSTSTITITDEAPHVNARIVVISGFADAQI